jgi:hypothetical protein
MPAARPVKLVASRAVDIGDVAGGFERTRTSPITSISAECSQNSLICSSLFGALFKSFEIPGRLDGRHRSSIQISLSHVAANCS